ncbi:MAG: hypothetical protein M3N51_07790 [Actinomycetota bacterium]|nr:hypothetical protein [Actinomycetota bacterium]
MEVETLRIIFLVLFLGVFGAIGLFTLWLLSTTSWTGRWASRLRRR